MKAQVYLLGGLSCHRRGDVISDYLPVDKLEADSQLPEHGTLMMFGQEWQIYTPEQQASLMSWLKSPGRVILLLPPFNAGLLSQQMDWHVETLLHSDKTTDTVGLAEVLADETRIVFKAQSYQFSREHAHIWGDDTLNTLYYKSHSSGGLLVASSLPLWSLTCLDSPLLVQAWLEGLNELAGSPQEEKLCSKPNNFEPDEKHLALLCCAYGRKLKSTEDLLSRVQKLGLFRFSDEELGYAICELIEHGLVVDGELTDEGNKVIEASPYQIYAEELKRMPG
ncbi:hypothetical protein HB762_07780 [Vibrio campbellii]|uniref:Uncharacterized protein n=1 Tax=Vibrio campbellii TaxID=680 RepID=A0ABY5IEI6_9VIBR|nr:hypothetical protein [Vibrio campbellii]UTZ31304.1 hypothetical protein HB762_07780 [Vibrio campbellii]